jgi:hypothetical protein
MFFYFVTVLWIWVMKKKYEKEIKLQLLFFLLGFWTGKKAVHSTQKSLG